MRSAFRPAHRLGRAGCASDFGRPARRIIASGRAYLVFVIGAEAWLVALVVDELPDAFLAAFIVLAVGRFLRADEDVFGVVISHLANPAHRVLSCFERNPVLALQHLRNRKDPRLEAIGRERLIDEARPLVGLLELVEIQRGASKRRRGELLCGHAISDRGVGGSSQWMGYSAHAILLICTGNEAYFGDPPGGRAA